MNREKIIALLSLVPFFVILTMFILAPFAWILINSFILEDGGVGFENYREIIESKFFMQGFTNSIYISLNSSVVAIIIALFGSYSLYKISPSQISNIFLSFNSMTSNFSGIPLAFAFIILMGTNGFVNILLSELGIDLVIDIYGKSGVNIIYIYFQIPLAILLLYPAFDSIDKSSMESSCILGASKVSYWFRVGIMQILPSILGVFVILFANAIGAYATIYAISSGNFNVVPIRISSLISGDISLNPYLASAFSVMLFLIMLVMSVIFSFISNKFNYKLR